MLPYFTVLNRAIGSYAVCAVIGLLVCGAVACRLGKREEISLEDIILLVLVAAGGMFLGGHLLYGLTHLKDIVFTFSHVKTMEAAEFLRRLGAAFGGMVFYGGFFGGTVAVILFSKKKKQSGAVELFALLTPLFHTFGRIGCFLGGCCYGIESQIGWIGPENVLTPDFGGVRRFPVQLTEAACNLILFLILFYFYKKGKRRLLRCYLCLYPPVRFLLEFLRGDVIRGILFGLSTSQWISLILWIAAMGQLLFETVFSIKKTEMQSRTEDVTDSPLR